MSNHSTDEKKMCEISAKSPFFRMGKNRLIYKKKVR